jgi:hypothetical protein
MMQEELARFSLVLREADRVRAQIERDEAIARADAGGDSLQLAVVPAGERFFASPMFAAV